MSSLTFFGAHDDHIAVLEFVVAELGCEVFEAYSEYDRPLRSFTSAAEIDSAFDLGFDPHGNGLEPSLMLWAPSTGVRPRIERLPLKVRNASFREKIAGWGLIQLQLGGTYGHCMTASRFAHNSEARARKWQDTEPGDPVSMWDWDELQRISNKLRYHMSRRMAVAKLDAAPVLPAAAALRGSGFELVRR